MRYGLTFLLGMIAALVVGQQRSLDNLYFFDLIYANPAYTGHDEALTASTIYRNQWVGFEGAPETFQLAVHSPLKNENMGVGFQAAHDRIGAHATTSLSLLYAYRLRISDGSRLSFGLRATAENHQFNRNEIDYRDEGDAIGSQNSGSVWAPAFDFGVMISSERYFAGIEVNNLSQSKIRDVEFSEARQYLHGRLIGGYLFHVSEKFSLKPNVLVRYASNAPVQFDINLNALIIERFWLGMGYRFNYGLLAMIQFRITDKLELGYAYDFATNHLRSQHSGSHELFLSYRFNLFKANFTSPRYF